MKSRGELLDNIACKLCKETVNLANKFKTTSEGDVELVLEVGGREYKYLVPDSILHFIADHGYRPPKEFIEVITKGNPIEVVRMQTKILVRSADNYLDWYRHKGYTPIGYLTEKLPPQEKVPAKLVDNLKALMESAEGFPITY